MKKNLMKTVAIICLTALFSCNNSSETPKQEVTAAQNKPALGDQNTSVQTSLSRARANIRRYDSISRILFNDSVLIRAYTIHAADLLEVLGLPLSYTASCQYDHARVYLGLDSVNHFKLYFTPVTGADLSSTTAVPGTDVILGQTAGNANSGYVLDLNAPCPKTCDELSPLYNPQPQ